MADQYQLYHIALSPDLDITLEEFADALNEDPEARAKRAEVQISESGGAKFLDPTLAAALLSVPAGVASSVIYGLIEAAIHRLWEKKGQEQTQTQSSPRHIHFEQRKKRDGTEILIIDMDF